MSPQLSSQTSHNSDKTKQQDLAIQLQRKEVRIARWSFYLLLVVAIISVIGLIFGWMANSRVNELALFPFAILSQAENRENLLSQIAQEIDKINNNTDKSNLAASTAILAGLVLNLEIYRRYHQ